VGYSVLATVAAVYLFVAGRPTAALADPFARIPDFYGEYQRAERRSGKTIAAWVEDERFQDLLPPNDRPLPPSLRTRLGESLTVGDLVVTPTKVERVPVEIRAKDGSEHPEMRDLRGKEWLLLHLHLVNRSADVAFHPSDPAFNRASSPSEPDRLRPYMRLEVGNHIYFGGPFRWPLRSAAAPFVAPGQEQDDVPLEPGQERTTTVFSPLVTERLREDLEKLRTQWLWRVQLRRGLVPTAAGEVSATAVIGVEFRRDEIQEPTPAG
jgi:hypothetical protein